MKILFVADVSIEKVIGGAERVLRNQTTRLARRGHDVHVLTRRVNDHTVDRVVIEGVTEWRYPIDTRNDVIYLFTSFKNCRDVYKRIEQEHRFELINAHQPFSAFAIDRLTRTIPKVYTCHSLSFEEYQNRNAKSNPMLVQPNKSFRRFIEKSALSSSRKIIVLSQFTKDKLRTIHHIPDDKVDIIPGAVDTVRFHPPDDKGGIRKQLGIDPKGFCLFTLRNLVPRMGLENLLEAMHLIRDRIPACRLYLGGEGPLKSKLETTIRTLNLTNVTLTGFLSDTEMVSYYQMADFFILPTIALEGFGLVTVEALASGTPVLGTPIGGTKEILGSLDETFLFSDCSPDAMAERIVQMHTAFSGDPEAYRQLSAECRAFAVRHYSWDINIDQTERLFQSCAASAEK